jgi:hypothetical protein
VSVTSAGCVLWLEQFQPLFGLVALATLSYQAWLVRRRPPHRRTPLMQGILWTSVATSGAVAAALLFLSLRYW